MNECLEWMENTFANHCHVLTSTVCLLSLVRAIEFRTFDAILLKIDSELSFYCRIDGHHKGGAKQLLFHLPESTLLVTRGAFDNVGLLTQFTCLLFPFMSI